MKKFNVFTLFPIIFLALLMIFAGLNQGKNSKANQRKKYDMMLRSEYLKFKPQEKEKEGPAKADQPEMAALQDYFMTLDPKDGRVPSERLINARKITRELEQSARLKSDSPEPPVWNIVSSNMGGRTRCVTYDPNASSGNKVWAGSVTGGLWYNDNITSALSLWVPVGDFLPDLAISAITFDPNNTQTMYIGTGEAFTARIGYRESSGLGMGIFKSLDGGQSWDLLASTSGFKYVTDIKIRDENGTSVIYAGVVSGNYHGTHLSQPNDGLYRSIDGGQNWDQVLPLIPGSTRAYSPADIEITASGRILIGTMPNIDGDGGATILYSDQGIAGTWTIFDDYVSIIENNSNFPLPDRVMLAAAPSDPNVAYALFGAGYVDSSDGFVYSQGRYIARTDDGGVTWNSRPIPSGGYYFWATIAWHALKAAVDPNNADHVFIGGLDVYGSSNGGQSWQQASDWVLMYYGGGDQYTHADIHDILFKPGSSNEMLVTSDGGIFYTNEASQNTPAFQQRNQQYGSLQFYSCAINPNAGVSEYLGGLQDNGTVYYTGTPFGLNDMIDGGDGAYCFIDQKDPQYMITSVYYNQYTLWRNGNYYQSMNDWQSGIFVNPADYDDNLKILYNNACDYVGTDINKILKISGIPNSINGSFIPVNTGLDTWFSALTYSRYSPVNKSTLFLGSASGNLFKVENAQGTPITTDITGNDFPLGNISCVAIGGSEDTLLVTFSNYGVTSVWQTYDGGNSWTDVEGNLPDMPIRWALYYPTNGKYAMLATEMGIWTSSNLDQPDVSWTPANDGLANVRVDMLKMRTSDNTVIAATHGRGLATTFWDISTGLNELAQGPSLKIYPNPTRGEFVLDFAKKLNENARVSVFNTRGQKLFDQAVNARSMKVDLSAHPSGEYILKIESSEGIRTEKIILQK